MNPTPQDLKTTQALVERVTALGHSWDTAVQLLTIQALIEVSFQLDTLSKGLSVNASPNYADPYYGATVPSSPERGGGDSERQGHAGVLPSAEPDHGKRGRGRPRKAGRVPS